MIGDSTHITDGQHAILFVSLTQQLSMARTMGEVMKLVSTAARQLSNADGATFVLRDGNLCFYADENAISPLWKGNRFPMSACISGWAMLNKQPVIIRDIYLDERIPHDAYKPTFVRSLAMIPIRAADPIGAIGNYWSDYHVPTAQEIVALQALADLTAVTIAHIQVQDHLNEKLKERTRMLEDLQQQKKLLEEFNQAIAHNLRAPLSSLMLLADLIAKSEKANAKLQYLEMQRPMLDSLNQAFEDLVHAMHIRRDYTISSQFVDFEECLDEILVRFKPEIEKTNAGISFDFSQMPTAYYPPQYLSNIFSNLLSNALRFRAPNRTPTISLSSFKRDGWTYLQCTDNGSGIDLQQHGHRLFKLRQTFHARPDAKGFGLFIIRTQIEAMGGSISADSQPDAGTTFLIRLFQNKEL